MQGILRLRSLCWDSLESVSEKNIGLHNKISIHKYFLRLFIGWILFESQSFLKYKIYFREMNYYNSKLHVWCTVSRSLSHFLKVHSIQKDLIWLSKLSILVFCCLQYKKIISSCIIWSILIYWNDRYSLFYYI